MHFLPVSVASAATVSKRYCSGMVSIMLAGLVLASSHASADALRVNGNIIDGVDVSSVVYRSGELNVQLAQGSNEIASAPPVPDFPVPSGDLCDNGGSNVACKGALGVLQDRVFSDNIELSGPIVYASEFILPTNVNPTLLVLEFRSDSAILPQIDVSISTEPGGAAIGSGGECSFTISGYVGARVYLAHNDSSASLKERYCDIVDGTRYFLNMSLHSGNGSAATVRRTIKLTGI